MPRNVAATVSQSLTGEGEVEAKIEVINKANEKNSSSLQIIAMIVMKMTLPMIRSNTRLNENERPFDLYLRP